MRILTPRARVKNGRKSARLEGMCGRCSQTGNRAELADYFGFSSGIEPSPRWNLAPGQQLAAVRETPAGRELCALRWGLIPAWSRGPSGSAKTFNARCETAADTPSFRAAFRARRCLVPADGFYEWQKRHGGKQPWFISRRDGHPLALAGLWESWQPQDGPRVESCTILTTAANRQMAGLHHRMPVILEREDFARWLDPGLREPEEITALLHPVADELLELRPVSDYVNRVGNEGPRCLSPAGPPAQGSLFDS